MSNTEDKRKEEIKKLCEELAEVRNKFEKLVGERYYCASDITNGLFKPIFDELECLEWYMTNGL